jgi:hypothetical protein
MKNVKNVKQLIYSICLLLIISIGGCSQKTHIVSEGYDNTTFGNDLNVISEFKGDELFLRVNNPMEINYKLYFVYKYRCENKNGYSKERVYKGNDVLNPVFIGIPSNKGCNQSVEVVLKDFNDKTLYDSPVMKMKNIKYKKSL